MSDEVYQKLESMASHDHQSVDSFAVRKLEEFTQACERFNELERRAQQSIRENFHAAMAKVPYVAPMVGDEI